MTLDQKQKQFWNRHAKRNNNPRDANVSVLLGAFVSRSNEKDFQGNFTQRLCQGKQKLFNANLGQLVHILVSRYHELRAKN